MRVNNQVQCGPFLETYSNKPTIKRHFWGNMNIEWKLDFYEEINMKCGLKKKKNTRKITVNL